MGVFAKWVSTTTPCHVLSVVSFSRAFNPRSVLIVSNPTNPNLGWNHAERASEGATCH